MKDTIVSIVIPTYNRANDLRRCLFSLASQTYQDFEVIVCDDGSTDDSETVVKEFESSLKISYHYLENFGGPSRPRNVGIQNAKGKYIALLDSDDWWAPKKLETSVSILESQNIDLVYHDLYKVYSSRQCFFRKREKARNLKSPVFQDLILNGNAINNSSVVVRKSILDTVGSLDETPDLIAGEDYDYWLRIAKITDRFYRIPRTLGYYWTGGGNLTNPIRSLNILRTLQKKYQSDFDRYVSNRGKTPWWFYKTRFLVHLSLGNLQDAKNEIAFLQEAPLRIKWKYLFLFQFKSLLNFFRF
ncbi:glycosyltransferase family 2 protein [Leptospira kirschneri]|uniref:glycosyltransferase family 2 protein n=1 Tax=Leptospira kirschneri TaxID=29507 RepID=UPI0002927F91|nr:glycosyltransferase [Leptospira kirschneri]EKO58945.1 glycosyltransferase-like protein, family 2 [Leptospira kirschneri str. H2]